MPFVTVGLLYYFLRKLPPGTIAGSFRHASPLPLGIAAGAAALFLFCRAWRYRILLAGDPPTRFDKMAAITFAAFFPGLLLPGIASDAAFVYLCNRLLGRTVVRAGGAALAARVLDILSLMAIGLATAPIAGASLPRQASLAALAVLALGAVGFAGLRWARYREVVLGLVARLPKGAGLAERADRALHELGGPKRVAGLVVSTAATRTATAVQYTALFAALGTPLSVWQAWFALSLRSLLLAVPVQGLGGLGTTQAWWAAALVVMGFPLRKAEQAGFQIHLLDLSVSLPVSLAGVVWLLFYLLPVLRSRSTSK